MDGNGNNLATAPSTTLVMTISLDQLTGAVRVTGPIENRFVAYGMLELAKDAVRVACEQKQAGSRIVLPGIAAVGSV
jgi:hypothetical protein